MKKILAAAAAVVTIAGTASVASANQPIDAVPLEGTFLYELDFNSYGDAKGINGKGSLVVPDAGATGPTLSVEIAGLDADTKYKVRFGGPEDDNNKAAKCSQGPNALGAFNGDNSEFQIGGASLDTGPEGVLRWDYDVMAAFTGDRVLEVNNGEPVIVVTKINPDQTEGDIVACAEIGGQSRALRNPVDQAYPVALVGGQNPVKVNGSDISARGQVNLIGTRMTYDITLTGDSLISAGAGLQNHIVLLRSTASCPATIDKALKQSVAALTNFQRSTEPPRVKSDLISVYPRSPISFTNNRQLKVQGSVTLPGVNVDSFDNWGLVVLGLEEGDTSRPGGLKGLQNREVTPSACLTLVDRDNEVAPPEPVPVEEATTLLEIQNAPDYRSNPQNKGTDQEIMRLYTAFFNRTPDVDGVKYWIGVSKGSQGTTFNTLQIAEFFMPSREFQNTFASVPDADFVATVYRNVLDREPDAAGLAYWNDILAGTNNSGNNPRLDKVANRGQLVYYVAINDEFVNRLGYAPS